MSIAILAPLLLAASTGDVSTLDCPAIIAKDDYNDDYDLCITAPMAKPIYEEGMTCIGKFHATREMETRLTQFISEGKRAEWTKQIEGNDDLAAQIDSLLKQAKEDPDLDAAVGQAAYDAARAPMDTASAKSGPEQLKIWQADPQISKRCLSVMDFWDANLATRASERPRPDEEDLDESE